MALHADVVKGLKAKGFEATTYEGQEGIFYVKKCRAEDMPYFGNHVVDGDFVYGSMEVITEVTPDGEVQCLIIEIDYHEGLFMLGTPEADALIKDAADTAAIPK